jgi:hypothetical protein
VSEFNEWLLWSSLGAGVAALVILVSVAWAYWRSSPRHPYWRPKKKAFEPPVLSGWRPTDHIDFMGSDDVMLSTDEDTPAQFVLLVQEERLVANISDLPTTEIRWRYANKAEAKKVVRVLSASSPSAG